MFFDPNTLLSDVSCSRGAPHSRIQITDNQEATVTLFRMRMVDGCEDVGGAYWGNGQPLYAAIGEGFQMFMRANSLEEAKSIVSEEYPNVKIETSEVNDDFVNGYIRGALFTSNDDSDEPLDSKYCESDIEPESMQKIIHDCQKFLNEFGHLLIQENYLGKRNLMSDAGIDFWLTRNRSGSGFWDGEWSDSVSETLTEGSYKFDECNLIVEEGKIFVE